MEQAKAYIESGILELYVLGQLSDQENTEVEAMASKYPEVLQEIRAIENAMERYAFWNALEPRSGIDKKIVSAITAALAKRKNTQQEPVSMPQLKSTKTRNMGYALAACIALLLVSTVALISSNSKLSEAKQQIADLNLQNREFVSTVGYMKQNNADLQKIAGMIDDPNWAIVKLGGTKTQPASRMMVYWNKKDKNVLVDKSKMVLPENDPEHQYQLWALVNGKPVGLGVFDMKSDSAGLLLKMKEIPAAQAFAVTLEKRGGSLTPTMEQLFVLGNVTI